MIETIFHISDLHIFQPNFVNLRSSFKILVENIIEAGIDQSILVIVGDIFEHKTSLETDVIYHWKMFCKLLQKENIKCLIIPGNHDINGQSRLLKDNVSILVTEFNNIVCINETCILDGKIFGAPNIDFYIFSPIDLLIPQIQNNNKIKIALLHEPIEYAMYDNGLPTMNNRFRASDLSAFDYVFLGDLHKHQFLTTTIAYSGSFVQKNKGESIEKGYIKWDLINKKSIFHTIPLREVYIKIDAYNNNCHFPNVSPDQTIRHLSLFHKNCSVEYIETLKKTLVTKYGYINRIVNNNKLVIDNKISKDDLNESNIIKNRDNAHEDIIKSILKDNTKTKDIIQHHKEVLKNRSESTFTTYKLNYMCWSNILCYGPNNYIDFRNFKNNIVMINGKNKEGKSSIIDIIIIALFNEMTRGYKEAIINKTKQKGSIKLSFNIGSVEYIIEHLYNRTAKSQQHRLYQDGINITKDSLTNTYKFLRDDIGLGDYKNFVNMSTALQNRKYLVDMTQNDFISLLTKICNLDILKDVENENKKEINVLKAMNKKFNQEIDQIPEIKKLEIKELKLREEMLTKKKDEYYKEISKISASIIELNRRYNNTEIPHDIDQQINNITSDLKSYSSSFVEINKGQTIDSLMQQIHVLDKKLEVIPQKVLDKIMNTDYTTEIQIDRPTLMKQIKDLQEIAYKPDETILVEKSQSELKKIIDAYKPKYLQPLEVCLIQELIPLNTQHENSKIIEIGLPNYNEVESEIISIKNRIQIFQDNFGTLVFNNNCNECTNNKHNINKIFDIEFEKGRLEILMKCLNQKSETIEKYNQAVAYREQKIQNDILIRNRITQELNDQIIYEAELFHKSKDSLKYLNNKHNWETLQKLERRINWVKECEVKKTEIERQKLTEIYHFVSKNNLLKCLQKLNKIRDENNNINSGIEQLKNNIEQIQEQIVSVNNELRNHLIEYNKKRDQYINRKQLIVHHSENVDKLEFLDLYQNCINCKTGIPSYILKQTCMMIEKNCNKILTKIADFTLGIVYDKEIKIYTIENDISIPASMGSGMQKFVLDLIFRITLTQISSISCPKTLFVDEGFGSLDAENFIAIANILQKLKTDFDSLIIISHISELRNYVDISIEITRKGYLSSVNFGDLTDNQKILQLSNETNVINKRNAKFVNDNNESKKQIVIMDKELQKYCDDNGGLEVILIDSMDNKIYCKACKKEYKYKHGFIDRHLNAASSKAKHEKFITDLINHLK